MDDYGTYFDSNLSTGNGASEPDFSPDWDHVADEGNPGTAFVVNWNFDSTEPSSTSGGFSQTAFLYRHTTTWNPSVQGDITALDFSIQYRTSDDAFEELRFWVGDNSDGKFTFASHAVNNDGLWHTFSLSDLTIDDFQPINSLIDLSGNEPIRFGFGLFGIHPNGYGSGNPSANTIAFDNYTVQIVPEPSVGALVVIGGLVGLGLRRRRLAS
jgi:hypothetical protein